MLMQQNVILAGTTAVLFALPLVYIIFWRMRHHAHWKPLLLGVLGFVVSARVLELLVHFVFLISDNPISRAINGSTPLYVLYGISMAGIFEEVGRWVMFTVFRRKLDRREDAIMYGIGHGGIEVWIVTLPVVLIYLMVAIGGNAIPAETAAALMPSVQAFGLGTAFCFIIERVFCMGVHISLTMIVFYGVRNRNKQYLLLAIIAHMVLDTLPALYQRGAVGIVATELWLGVCCVVLCFLAYRLYQKLREGSTAPAR
ncbi:MAG: YhfC family intramembrane metalloprotease [Butyricicoccus sp.]